MDVSAAIRELRKEWRVQTGFFWRLRKGQLDLEGAERVSSILEEVEVEDGETIDRRFVAEVWHIPLFMYWQTDRVLQNGGDGAAFGHVYTRISDLVRGLLEGNTVRSPASVPFGEGAGLGGRPAVKSPLGITSE